MCATDCRRCFSFYENWFEGRSGKTCDPRRSSSRKDNNNSNNRYTCSCKSAARVIKSSLRHFITSGKNSSRSKELSIRLLLLVISIGVFLNSMNGDFVHDDLSAICSNPDVMGQSSLIQVFSNDFWGKPMSDPDSHKSYRPLTTLSFRLNMFLSSREMDHPAKCSEVSTTGFHFVNILLHASVVQLIFLLVRQESNFGLQYEFMMSAYFAVHPIHTEAVSSIVGRADLMVTFFYLLSLLTYSRSVDCETRRGMTFHLTISTLSAVAALLSKETGITVLPLCVILCLLKEIGRKRPVLRLNPATSSSSSLTAGDTAATPSNPKTEWRGHQHAIQTGFGRQQSSPASYALVVPMITFLALLAFRIYMLNGQLPFFSEQDNPASFSESLQCRSLTFSYLMAFNMAMIVFPENLSYDWQMGSIPLITSVRDHRNLLTLVLIASILLICVKCRHLIFDMIKSILTAVNVKQEPKVFQNSCHSVHVSDENDEDREENGLLVLALCLLLLSYLPASNLLVTVGFVVAERILYLPSLAIAVIIVTGWRKLIRFSVSIHSSKLNSCLKFLFYALLLLNGLKTIHRNRVWSSRVTLFESGLISAPNNAKVHYNYANLQKDVGNLRLAEMHYRTAISLWPRHESSHNNLGTILSDPREAESHFQEVLRINPYHAKAYFNLANLYRKRSLSEKAISLLKRSIELDRNLGEAYSLLASLHADAGRVEEAEILHVKALQVSPRNADFINNYAVFLHSRGNTPDAVTQYRKALTVEPRHRIARSNILHILNAAASTTRNGSSSSKLTRSSGEINNGQSIAPVTST